METKALLILALSSGSSLVQFDQQINDNFSLIIEKRSWYWSRESYLCGHECLSFGSYFAIILPFDVSEIFNIFRNRGFSYFLEITENVAKEKLENLMTVYNMISSTILSPLWFKIYNFITSNPHMSSNLKYAVKDGSLIFAGEGVENIQRYLI